MADANRLAAKLSLIDEVTSKFSDIVASGSSVISTFDNIDSASNDALDAGAAGTFADALNEASASADNLSSASRDAAEATDYWTDAVGGYDKSALEAVYTTQELVDMGYKLEEALDAERQAVEENVDVMEKGTGAMQEFRATIEEQEAELSALQEAYMGVSLTMGQNSDEAVSLKQQIDDLSETLDGNRKELEDLEEASGKTGDAGDDMVKKIEDALTTAALAAAVKEIAEAVYEMADAFSEAESVIVKATGATEEQLDSLNDSMMRVYATVDDDNMSNTAAAIGELNTRLGLQGEELELVTGLFMLYADNTNSEVVSAVQNVTKVMKNWNVEVEDTELLLDKFTYAAQASGASVDNLSDLVYRNKAFLDQLGYSLDESIALFSMLEYEGIEASSVMMGFRTAITNFSNDGKDAQTAMQEIIEEIRTMKDASAATSLAIDTFGSRVGAQLSDKIRAGKFDIEDWTAAIAEAGGTLAETDEAADTLADKWTMASNSMNAAFTTVLSPAVSAVSESLAGFVQGIGDFLNEHPTVTKAITALGVGLIALAGYIIVTKVAALASTPSFAAMGAAIWAATGPVGLIVAGVAALVTGLGFLIGAVVDTDDEFNNLTASSKQQYEEIRQLNAEYEEAAALYGKTSYEAQSLKWQIDDLTAAYEANKMSLEDFIGANDALIESHDELISSYRSSVSEIDEAEASNDALINKLYELGSATDQTAGTEEQMKAIIEALNSSVDGLNLSYEDIIGNADGTAEAIRKIAQAQADQERYTENQATLVDLIREQADLENQLALATANATAAQERYDNAAQGRHDSAAAQEMYADYKNLQDYSEEVERLTVALDENVGMQDELSGAMADYVSSANEVTDSTDAVSSAIESVQNEIDELVAAYDEAYQAAYDSINSQIGLFDTMSTEVTLSTDDMLNAWSSQVSYLETYAENLRRAAEYGIDEGLVASLSDGSAESAGYLEAIVSNIESLGGSVEGMSDEASSFVSDFNTAFGETETAKEQFATTVAEMETDFSAKMSEIEARMSTAIDNMEMETEAAAAAKNTIQAYINQIKSMTSEAHSAAAAVAAAATSALSGSGTGSIGVSGYASGTVSADDVYIAGEDGPELIVGAGGSTVFPTSETSHILNAIEFGRQRELDTGVLAATRALTETRSESSSTEIKTITLQINGSGSMTIDGSLTEDEVLEILYYNLKPVLLSVVRSEIMEEGEQSYDF